MSTPILVTKLYIPASRPNAVLRPRLLGRLNEGMHRNLTLVSAPAGFGKTTLVSEWARGCGRPTAWLSLDEGDNDPARFLTYLVAAVQTVAGTVGGGLMSALHSPQPPPPDALLTVLINEIALLAHTFALVLDDYHIIESQAVDQILTFLLNHLPPPMRLVIATREDPPLPLAQLRVRGQLTELRAAGLRFTPAEAAEFLNEGMGLNLSTEAIAALESRTEGWIAGLQLAAISLQGHQDTPDFIKSFTGSHRFVLDYLLEEVLQRQPPDIQHFLLRTSILDRLCGSLCDALLPEGTDPRPSPAVSGQATLEYLDHANLFITPLDNERRWYRYHHLFADLLRQRFTRSAELSNGEKEVVELHRRASGWFEEHGLEAEAFHHAVAAEDVPRATRLVEGQGMPLFFRGVVAPVLKWLDALPPTVLNTTPSLWVMYASALLFASQTSGVEPKLQAAEAALQGRGVDDKQHDLIGHIASIRATLAVSQHDVEGILTQSHRALAHLHPDNLPVRTATTWTLGYAHHLRGERAAASRAYAEALSISQRIGHAIITILATIGLGNMQEADTHLHQAAGRYREVLRWLGEPPLPIGCEAHLGLARIVYEWNDLEAAQRHAEQALYLARQLEQTDRAVACQLFLARLHLTQRDISDAAAMVAQASQAVRQHRFVHREAEVVAAQVMMGLHQGNLAAAAHLAQTYDLPLSQGRVYLAQGDPAAALALLEPARLEAEAKGWADERFRLMLLQALALHAQGESGQAAELLGEGLALAEAGGYLRTFVDEGEPMARLLTEAAAYGRMPDYIRRLLALFKSEAPYFPPPPPQSLPEPLSQRELEVLRLVAQGLSNHEISERLFLALSTVKGHNQLIFDKLQVRRRTEAVARARALGLL